MSFRAHDGIRGEASVQLSNKSNIQPHSVIAEVGPKEVPDRLSDHRDPVERDPAEDDKLFDVEQLRQSVSYVSDAVRDHKVAALATFVVVFGAACAVASLWPKTYEADGRLLLQRNEVTASLVNPGRTIPAKRRARRWRPGRSCSGARTSWP